MLRSRSHAAVLHLEGLGFRPIQLTTVTLPSTTKPSSAKCCRTSSFPVTLPMVGSAGLYHRQWHHRKFPLINWLKITRKRACKEVMKSNLRRLSSLALSYRFVKRKRPLGGKKLEYTNCPGLPACSPALFTNSALRDSMFSALSGGDSPGPKAAQARGGADGQGGEHHRQQQAGLQLAPSRRRGHAHRWEPLVQPRSPAGASRANMAVPPWGSGGRTHAEKCNLKCPPRRRRRRSPPGPAPSLARGESPAREG